MSDFRPLSPQLSVSPQVSPGDMKDAAAGGFALVINNRPDFEAPDQPTGDDIEAAARAAGLAYAAIPIGPAGIGMADIEACATLLRDSGGPVLMYCRSGTRSAHLATLATALLGGDVEGLIAEGAHFGYALEPLRDACRRLAGG
jgi:uncharacterized protein (TIGR01244 family)